MRVNHALRPSITSTTSLQERLGNDHGNTTEISSSQELDLILYTLKLCLKNLNDYKWLYEL